MSIRFSRACCLAVLVAITVCLSPNVLAAQKTETSGKAADIEGRRAQLLALFDEEWQYELRTNPEMATGLGDNRYNDRLDDHSPEFYQSDVEARGKFLTRFEAIDPAGLSAQDSLSRELMIRNLRQDVEGARFKNWEMPVNQMGGPHLNLLELLSLTPFNSLKDYDDYISRLHQVPKMLEQVTANMRQGMKDGLMQPRYLLEKVVVQAQEISDQNAEGSPFAKPVDRFPAGISDADQKRLRSAVLSAVQLEILPAYKRFTTFVRDDYAAHGRTDPGVWALPDGVERDPRRRHLREPGGEFPEWRGSSRPQRRYAVHAGGAPSSRAAGEGAGRRNLSSGNSIQVRARCLYRATQEGNDLD